MNGERAVGVQRSSFIVHPSTPLANVKGVAKSRSEALTNAGLVTLSDLLWFFPFRYEDRRHPARIADLGRHLDTPVSDSQTVSIVPAVAGG